MFIIKIIETVETDCVTCSYKAHRCFHSCSLISAPHTTVGMCAISVRAEHPDIIVVISSYSGLVTSPQSKHCSRPLTF